MASWDVGRKEAADAKGLEYRLAMNEVIASPRQGRRAPRPTRQVGRGGQARMAGGKAGRESNSGRTQSFTPSTGTWMCPFVFVAAACQTEIGDWPGV